MRLNITLSAFVTAGLLAGCATTDLPNKENVTLMSETVRPGIANLLVSEARLSSTSGASGPDMAMLDGLLAQRSDLGTKALKVATDSAADAQSAQAEATYMRINSHNLAAEAALDAELMLITGAGEASIAEVMPAGGVRFAMVQLDAASQLCASEATADDSQRCAKTYLLNDRARIEPPAEEITPELQVTRRVMLGGADAATTLPDTSKWRAVASNAEQLEAAFESIDASSGGAPAAVARWSQMERWVCNLTNGKAQLAMRVSNPTPEQRAAANTAIRGLDSAIIAGAAAMDGLAAASDGAPGLTRVSATAEALDSCGDEACVTNRNLMAIESHCRGVVAPTDTSA
ncbi:MAG: hypothetical protein AAF216_06795 [Pseudomonadota bacterium]